MPLGLALRQVEETPASGMPLGCIEVLFHLPFLSASVQLENDGKQLSF